jgi:hypothetical protein
MADLCTMHDSMTVTQQTEFAAKEVMLLGMGSQFAGQSQAQDA